MSGDVLSNKHVGESVVVSFEFTDAMLGETISSVDSVEVTVVSGTDPSPEDILNGTATIDDEFVLQPVTGGLAGVDYRLVCTITTNGNRVLQLDAILPVVALPPATQTFMPSKRWTTEAGITYTLTLVEWPTEEPISVPEAKRHLRVTDDSEDEDIEEMITAAREQAEHLTGLQLVTATWLLTADQFPTYLPITLTPLQSITSIEYLDDAGDLQTLDEDQYIVDTVGLSPSIRPAVDVNWPTTYTARNAVQIELVAGFGSPSSVPLTIKRWMKVYIATMYRYREEVEAGNLSRLQFVDRLLDPNRTYA